MRKAAEESPSLVVCGRALHSLGAELEKALTPNDLLLFLLLLLLLLLLLPTALEIRRRGCDDERKGRAGIYRLGISS